MKILALDLGKSRSVACEYVAETGTSQFRTVATPPPTLLALLQRVHPDRVVIEIGTVTGWVADLVRSQQIELQVANTAHAAWRWQNTKRKTDRDDALRLAKLSAMNQLPQVDVPSHDIRQWRALIRYRHHLVRRRTQVKNRIRAVLDREGRTLPAGCSVWAAAGLATLHELACPIESVANNELWRGELSLELEALQEAICRIERVEQRLDALGRNDDRVRLLETIPGVGPRLAEIAVAMIDRPERFQSAKQVAAYAGLTPRQHQSGDTDRQGRISKQGNALLRSMLVEVSWVGLRFNGWMRSVYEQVRRGSPARKKIAIVAVARRLLIRCWAMLRDGTVWRPKLLEII